jgi:hypothetical protein
MRAEKCSFSHPDTLTAAAMDLQATIHLACADFMQRTGKMPFVVMNVQPDVSTRVQVYGVTVTL